MEAITETKRMLIRPLCLDDVPELTQILGDPAVMKHSVRGVCDETATRRFVAWCQACYLSHGLGPWALVEKGAGDLVGFCGLGPERVGGVEEVNLGYRLARRYWGRGLATEAACAAVDDGFGVRGCESLVVIIEPEHMASLRVAEKAGFCDYQPVVFHGKPVRLYRMTRGRWEAARSSNSA